MRHSSRIPTYLIMILKVLSEIRITVWTVCNQSGVTPNHAHHPQDEAKAEAMDLNCYDCSRSS